MKPGFTVGNRSVLFGATTNQEMFELSEMADASGRFQSVWMGDSLLDKPCLEAIALLAGLATRTQHVRVGPACMSSFALRDSVQLVYQ